MTPLEFCLPFPFSAAAGSAHATGPGEFLDRDFHRHNHDRNRIDGVLHRNGTYTLLPMKRWFVFLALLLFAGPSWFDLSSHPWAEGRVFRPLPITYAQTQMPLLGVAWPNLKTFALIQDSSMGGSGCTPASTTCTFALTDTTTAHTVLIASPEFYGTSATAPALSTAYDCTVSSGCTSGNAIDTFSVPASHACLTNAFSTGFPSGDVDAVDCAYVLNGAGGATYMTITLSANGDRGTGNNWYAALGEWSCSGPCGSQLSVDLVIADSTTGAIVTGCGTCTLMSFSAASGPSELMVVGNGSCNVSTVGPSPWQKSKATGADFYMALNVGVSVVSPQTTQTSGCGAYAPLRLSRRRLLQPNSGCAGYGDLG
jgi:hypothetical protein